MIKKVGLILIALIGLAIVGIFSVASMQPTDFRIERTAVINSPREVVFEQVDDFHKWQAWSPWAKMDPSMTATYSGAERGVGAMYTWSGNSQVGEGRMTLVENAPASLVRIKLEFMKPMQATNMTDFSFTTEGSATKVAWVMTGQNSLVSKVFGLFVDVEKMVGADFERGLAALKAVVEQPQAK